MNYDGFTKYDAYVAQSYDEDREKEEHWKLENHYIRHRYTDRKIDKLLDLPLGTGRFLEFYQGVESITGIDISQAMLDEAKRKNEHFSGNITYAMGDAFHLPFPDDHFDDVVCFRLVHLIPPQLRKNLLMELARVTSSTLILQAYILKERSFLSMVKSRIFSLLKARPPSGKSAWSHIQAYSLCAKGLHDLLGEAALIVDRETLLCEYAGSDVYVFELSKQQS